MRRARTTWLTGLAALIALAPLARAEDPAPAKKDTGVRLQPKEVVFSTEVAPAVAKPGDTVKYTVKVKVEPGWHIYAYSEVHPADGPRSTQFDFFNKGGLEPKGNWTAHPEPVSRPEPAFKGQIFSFHEDEVEWSHELTVPAGAEAGEHTLQSQISFMICTDQNCKPPTRVTVPAAKLTIEGGGAAAAIEAPAGEAPTVEETALIVPAAEAPEAVTPAVEAPTIEAAPAAAAVAPQAEAPVEALAPGEAATPVQASTEPVAPLGPTGEPIVGEVPPVEDTPAVTAEPDAGVAQQKINQGFGSFLLWCALGGVAALVMPCVWPMIPITVNFFVKQGQKQKGGSTLGLAVAYCLAIIGIFTLVGVVFSAVFDAGFLTGLANKYWLNLFIGLLFLAFGLSLLGLFEMRLPNFLLNASAQGESRGGLVGVMFMALTLTITSFTCTFPVVGPLLVMSSNGSYLYPVVGLATFASVLALPFFVLAALPSLATKMPKSGDWMNAVKVVGGLIEIGAAFKFLNAAEVSWLGGKASQAWIDSRVMLTVWVVIAIVCGIYLIGLFRTDHDHEQPKVGPLRLSFGIGFLALGLFFAPALFGVPPKGKVWNLVVGLLAADSGELDFMKSLDEKLDGIGGSGSGERVASGRKKASSADPAVAVREERTYHGVSWGMSYEAALEEAKSTGKPVLIDFTGVNCANCRLMEQSVLPDDGVVERLKQFVTVQLFTDFVPIDSLTASQTEELAEKNRELEIDLTSQQVMPLYVILSPEGKVLGAEGGYIQPEVFSAFLDSGLGKAGGTRVASAAGVR